MLPRNLKQPTVELEEFLSHWKVSHAELAVICECNIATVEQWFLDKAATDYCPPTELHLQLLAQAHYLWRIEARKERTDSAAPSSLRASCLRQMYWQKHCFKGGDERNG